jgi:hypothetical protein
VPRPWQGGEALELAREPANPHDPLAVRVAWRGRKLGYVPRAENAPIARLLDAGQPLEARILAVGDEDNWTPASTWGHPAQSLPTASGAFTRR